MKGPIDWAITEAERIARLELGSIMMPLEVEGGYANLEEGPRLWATLEEIGLPLGYHIGTGRSRPDPRNTSTWESE